MSATRASWISRLCGKSQLQPGTLKVTATILENVGAVTEERLVSADLNSLVSWRDKR